MEAEPRQRASTFGLDASDNRGPGNPATMTEWEPEFVHPALQAIDSLLGSVAEAMVVVDAEGQIVLANRSVESLFGYGQGDLLGDSIETLLPAIGSVEKAQRELWGTRRDGTVFPVEVRSGPFRIEEIRYFSATIMDVTGVQAQRVQAHLAAVVQASDDGIISITTDGVIQTCNPGMERLIHRGAAWLVGQSVQALLPETDQQILVESFQQVYRGERVERREMNLVRKDGFLIKVAGNIFALRDVRGDVIGYSMIVRDIAAEAEARKNLERLARFDHLTGLASRSEVLGRLTRALKNTRSPGPQLGGLFCDIDHFKSVNDNWGHAVGDLVLTTVATRIRDCLRHGDTVGRTGGDEILVLLPSIHALDDAARIAEKIRCRVAEPIYYDEAIVNVTLSIGATLAVPGESVSKMTARADGAMYQSKQAGRNRVTTI